MAQEPLSQAKQLKKLAKLTGIDVEAALKEVQENTVKMAIEQIVPMIKQSQTAPVAVDMDVLTVKVVEALKPELRKHIDKGVADSEVRIAGKIAEVVDELQKKIESIQIVASAGAGTDPQAIIQGVAATLQPIIVEETQKAVEVIFKANFQALQAEIYRVMDEKFKQVQPVENTQPVVQGGGSGGLMQAVSAFMQTPVGEKILEKLFASPAAAVSDPVKALESYYKMDKIFRGLGVDGAEKQRVIETLTGRPIENPPA